MISVVLRPVQILRDSECHATQVANSYLSRLHLSMQEDSPRRFGRDHRMQVAKSQGRADRHIYTHVLNRGRRGVGSPADGLARGRDER